jgi:isoleucyl-tRNA synthetase
MERNDLRKKSLEAIDNVQWIPRWGKERIYGMIENRPDWCVSRQRSWGVPITAFACTACGEYLADPKVMYHVANLFKAHSADVWYDWNAEKLLPEGTICPGCGKSDFQKEMDILDVWFDSGVSHAAVLEPNATLGSPADLYLEGSDQHRGWFHSSLLESVGTRGVAPYRSVLTHGFVLDGQGRKMSKSLGNVVAPEDVIKKFGADVLRLWCAAQDYRDDNRISQEILTRVAESYRRIRNTCRYLLGNLYDFDPATDAVPFYDMMPGDRLALHQLEELKEKVLAAYEELEFHIIYQAVNAFCSVELSATYLDILKDRMYTSRKDSAERRSSQTAMYLILDTLTRLVAPVLSFTADEIWQYLPGTNVPSVHLASFPPLNPEWRNNELQQHWGRLLAVRTDVLKALELTRAEKVIGHSLDAAVAIEAPTEIAPFLKEFEQQLKTICIVSRLEVVDAIDGNGYEGTSVPGLKIAVTAAPGEKCERCWCYDEEIGADSNHPTICPRCVTAVT